MSVRVYKCYGGPFDGEYKTAGEVGEHYTQYNSSVGEVPPRYKYIEGNFYVTERWIKKHGFKSCLKPPVVEGAILVYTPSQGFVRV